MARDSSYYYLKMETHYLENPYYQDKRRVRVLLPKDYYQSDRHYPVLYMHDGQNVFYSKEAFIGHSWKIIPLIKRNPDLPQMIVVGIDNHPNRMDEYAPWPASGYHDPNVADLGGDGKLYGEWIVNQVKPFIDNHYRSLADRRHTMMAGSSMGGLITAYMGSAYPHIFGNIGVFSLASWFSENDFLDFIQSHPLYADNKVYIQVGTNEDDISDQAFVGQHVSQAYIDASLSYYQALIKSGCSLNQIDLNIFVDETHNEYYWAKHFPEFMRFIWQDHK
ncbi:esterase [Aerococcus urinaehominis]|uniref:Esterase n=1 Tax=Aerococcus urinaehominis TaxID=128944 RepID=A0A0X8FK33_9LACT|nr:alpha/beta hydrolase-fold protein [Aerococcus urinaehominis]AMB98773.1 esterase [Aerococcus urinaehominis]SDM13187.1 Predicted hydrolase of the alpha/beta superfamily [Aerococcus urinaehominis]